jgi:macrolide transport system ATP-binding/permease protein
VLGCLDRPSAGTYRFAGHDVAALDDESLATLRNRLVGFVFQGFHLLARTTALENVELPLLYGDLSADERRDRALRALVTVGLGDRIESTPAQLSGGEQQRVAIARALAGSPLLLLADEPTGNLDSQTTAAVLGMLQRLHREQRLTIVLVTHDHDVAMHATRIVTVKDGAIASDVVNEHPRVAPAPELPEARQPEPATRTTPRRRTLPHAIGMATTSVRLALRALGRNTMRGALTVLGILIGVAAVVAMTAIGAGAEQRLAAQLSALGVNMIVVLPGTTMTSGARSGTGTVATLTSEDADEIATQIPSVAAVAPSTTYTTQVVAGAGNWSTRVTGTTPEFFDVRAWPVARGASFDEGDLSRRAKVCVLGQTVASALFGDRDPVGEPIRVASMPCTVIGVLARKGQSTFGADQDDTVVLPISTMRANIGHGQGDSVQQIAISSRSRALTEHTATQVAALLRQLHHLSPRDEDDFQIRNLEELTRTYDEQARTIAMLLLVVASIALLVGGIGVMNIMLVSVTERTREIGIRRAVGARSVDVLAQFLVESVVLAVLGGVAGLVVGVVVSVAFGAFSDFVVAFRPTSALVAVVVSAAIGVVFGYFPARRAARLDPIEALRRE